MTDAPQCCLARAKELRTAKTSDSRCVTAPAERGSLPMAFAIIDQLFG
jgi:hypothetical protein